MNPHQRTHTDPPSAIQSSDPKNLVEAVSQRPENQRWTYPIYKALKPVLGSSIFQSLAALLYAAWTLWFGVAITSLLLHLLPFLSEGETFAGPNKFVLFGPTILVMLVSAIRVGNSLRDDFLRLRREPGLIYSFLYGAGHLGRLLITGWDRPWVYVARQVQTHVARQLSALKNKPALAAILAVLAVAACGFVVFMLIMPAEIISLIPPFLTGNDAALSLILPSAWFVAAIGTLSLLSIFAQQTLVTLRWLVVFLPALILEASFLAGGFDIYGTLSSPVVWNIGSLLGLVSENIVQAFVITQVFLFFATLFPMIAVGLLFGWLPRVIENYGKASGRSIILRSGEEKAEKRAREKRRCQINALTASIAVAIVFFGYVKLDEAARFYDSWIFAVTWIALIVTLMTWLVLTIVLRPKAFAADRINSMTIRGQGRSLFDGWSRYQSAVEAHEADEYSASNG